MAYDQETCKNFHFNLLRLLKSPLLGLDYVRKLDETMYCDQDYYQKNLRKETRVSLGSDRVVRIVNSTHDAADELAAIKLVHQRKDQHSREIWRRLSWVNRLQYGLQNLTSGQ